MQEALASARRFLMLAAVVITLAANPGATDTFGMPRLLALTLSAAAIAVLLMPYAAALAKRNGRTLGPLAAFVLALSLVAVLHRQSHFLTIYGAFGRANGWLCYAALAVISAAAAVAFDRNSVTRVLRLLAVTGICMALYAGLQLRGVDPIDWKRGWVMMGTFGNPDFLSGFLGVAAVAVFWMALRPGASRRGRAVAWAGLVLVLWVTRQSVASQGLVAFAVGALVIIGVLLWGVEGRGSRFVRAGFLTAVGFGAVIAVAGLANRGPLASLLFDVGTQHRFYMWEAALRMLQRSPVTGVGIEAYNDWYRVSRSADSVDYLGPWIFSNEAHSVLLNLFATGGILLGGAYLTVWTWTAATGLRAARDPQLRPVAAGLLGVTAAYVVDAAVSMDAIGIAVWGWLAAGALLGLGRTPDESPEPVSPGPRLRTALSSILVLSLAAAATAYAVVVDARIGSATLMPTDTAAQRRAAAQALVRAADATPEQVRVLNAVNMLEELGETRTAIALSRRAVERFPRESLLWQALAEDAESVQMWRLAVWAREQMLVLDPLNQDIVTSLGRDRAALG